MNARNAKRIDEIHLEDILYLIVSDNDESQKALDFVHRHGINPHVVIGSGRAFDGGYDDSKVPFLNAVLYEGSSGKDSPLLVVKVRGEHNYGTWGYNSFEGIKVYMRERIEGEEFGRNEFGHVEGKFWRNVKTFYPSNRFDEKTKKFTSEEENLVTCFDETREIIFTGPIDNAPYKLKEPLDRHSYKDWHRVSGWKVGEIDELFDSQNKRGTNKGDVIIKPKTRTVLFWDELANLSDGRKEEIILEDSSSMMHRTYEAYFNDNGTIFGIYANMID